MYVYTLAHCDVYMYNTTPMHLHPSLVLSLTLYTVQGEGWRVVQYTRPPIHLHTSTREELNAL